MLSKLSRRRLVLSALFLQPSLAASAKVLSIGGIRFSTLRHGSSRHRYLHIHGNESTAREVLQKHLQDVKGTAFFVISSERMVPLGSSTIDPNRMFSAVGAEANLKRFNSSISPSELSTALALLARDRERFIRALLPPRGGRMIALHNNSRGYSMDNEVASSEQVARNDPENPRDFMLATDPQDYARIATGPYNVVLQTGKLGTEDGSFSRLAAARGRRYVNIEAAIGSTAKQAAMLRFLEQVLP